MNLIEKKDGKIQYRIQDFDSIHDFNTYLEKAPLGPTFKTGRSQASKEVDNSREPWAGTNKYEQAEELFVYGWTQMAEKLAKRVKTVSTSQQSQRSKPVYSVVGGNASVPRYVMGIPTSMIDRKQIPMKSKIIVVNKDVWYPARVSSTTIFEEGVKALQIIQALEGKGYRVKLNACWGSQDENEIIGGRLVIKRPEDRFSLQKVAFPLAHPSFLRRILFKWLERFPTESYFGGYGRPNTDSLKSVFLGKNEIFLPKHIPDVDKFIENLNL